jgi:hypothetical protein
MAQPSKYVGEHLAERAIDAFRDGLIRRDFREELGRCKPKTINHLMSLANEWTDGEDSIAIPRSRRRSADRDIDPKDQFHPTEERTPKLLRACGYDGYGSSRLHKQ